MHIDSLQEDYAAAIKVYRKDYEDLRKVVTKILGDSLPCDSSIWSFREFARHFDEFEEFDLDEPMDIPEINFEIRRTPPSESHARPAVQIQSIPWGPSTFSGSLTVPGRRFHC